MFDTMTLTKIGGAVFGAFLIFLLGSWLAGSLYSTEVASGHGEEGAAHPQGYVIATADEGHGEDMAEEDTGPSEADILAILAAGDAQAGAKVFKKCKACHKLEEGVSAVGPDLFGVVGRDVASRDFAYSGGMSDHGGVWEPLRLNEFLSGPKSVVPGTKMSFKGLSKPEDRANVIAYLLSVAG